MKYSRLKLIRKSFLVLVVFFAAYIGNIVFFPRNLPNKNFQIIIDKDQNMHYLASELEKNHIIADKHIFLLILRIMGEDRKVVAGLYVLHNNVSMWDVISRITSGHPDQISVTIIEGVRFSGIKSYIDGLPNIKHITNKLSEDDLKALLKISAPNLEGLFYPTTYFIAPGQSDLEIYNNAYNLMQTKLSAIYAKKSSNTHYTTPYQMLILASLIQKETANNEDMLQIATVFNNRLGIGMKLQDDPAVFYGLHNIEKIDRKDFSIDTKYNTYLHAGLPPTPICIPGESAIIAASHPLNNSEILYFIAVGKGQTKFAESYDKHKAMIKKYLKKVTNHHIER